MRDSRTLPPVSESQQEERNHWQVHAKAGEDINIESPGGWVGVSNEEWSAEIQVSREKV
jgi:hypothetical protein